MKSLAKYFLQGLLYIVPIAVTIYVLYEIFVVLDGLIKLDIPGLGILIILAGITLIGFVGSFFIALPFTSLIERFLKKAPLVKLVYSSVKDLINAFVGKKKSFDKPVLVQLYGNKDVRELGFITSDDLSSLNIEGDYIAVYVPHSYAMSGQLHIVPKTAVSPLDAKSADVMKFIISGGVTTIEEEETPED